MGGKTPKNMPFRDIESLLSGLGCRMEEGEGSRVSFLHGKYSWTTHRPHPDKEAREYHFKRVREFLKKIGDEA